MNPLAYFVLNAAFLLPVMCCLDFYTPMVFLLLAAMAFFRQRWSRWPLFLGVSVSAGAVSFWVFLANVLWTVPDGGASVSIFFGTFPAASVTRSLLLALRAWSATCVSASFALGTDAASFMGAMMRSWRLSPRIGYAIFTALNLLPRMKAEAEELRAIHAVRSGGKRPVSLASVVTILARAIRHGERSSLSMLARGIESPGARTWYRDIPWKPNDTAELVGGLAAAATCLWFLVSRGLFRFGFY